MKRVVLITAALAALSLMTASALAHPHCRSRCGGSGPAYGPGPRFDRGPAAVHGPRHHRFRDDERPSRIERLYDRGTEETFDGEIVDIEVNEGRRGPRGVRLWVKENGDVIPVHLGPAWFLNEQDVDFEEGDRIIVKGSRIDLRRGEAVIAAEVRKDDRLLILRDEEGVPRWAPRQRWSD